MKDTNIFNKHFEDFVYNRFNSNTSEEIEQLETDFTTICSLIKQQSSDEIKKLLEQLFQHIMIY